MVRQAKFLTILTFFSAAIFLAGCGNNGAAGDPPISIGAGPGEVISYDDSAGFGDAGVVSTPGGFTAPPVTTYSPPPPPAGARTHTVQRGDTLFSIARQHYNGDQSKWRAIHEANRDKIPNPHDIKPGQVLRLP
jgi:nucleoid-associated protein YgaU